MKLQNKNAVITGAAKGMGAAITLTLAHEGADVFLTSRDTAALDEVAAEVRKLGRKAEVCACDVVEEEYVAAMAEKAKKFFGDRIDILINVAGVTGPIETPVQNIKPEEFSYVIESNIRGSFLPIKYVVPTMIAKRSGKIVNIGGTSGLRGYKYRAAYSSSKWGVRASRGPSLLRSARTTSTATWSVLASFTRRAWTSWCRKKRACAAGRSKRSTTNTCRRWR